MYVLKFGGTSVGTVASIRSLKPILKKRAKDGPLIVVVSAMAGITNQLLEAISLAEKGNDEYQLILKSIEEQHIQTIRELIDENGQSDILEKITKLLDELKSTLGGVLSLREATTNSKKLISSFGERMSSLIIYNYLKSHFSAVSLIDPVKIITCRIEQDQTYVQMEVSRKNAGKLKLTQLNVIPGFIAGDESGKVVTLGRGGSDYSAALFANFFDAKMLEIWSDVDGLMTADPRLVSNAKVIEELSYEEALELSHFGAKVIYPPSIQPAMVKKIPIQILNTFSPEKPGTRVTRGFRDQSLIRGISSMQDISLLNLKGSGMIGIPKFSYRLFQSLSENHINVILITQASSEHTICVGIESRDQKKAEKVINRTFSNEIETGQLEPVKVDGDLGIVALVGSSMKNQVGISGQMFSALGRNGISIKAIAQGSSERNISVVIEKEDLTKAINLLHESFFEHEIRRINLFMVGAGNVGKELLKQVKKQQAYLLKEHHLDVRVIALANSKKMIFEEETEGINLSEWEDKLKEGATYSIDSFIDKMDQINLRNSIFLDVTASGEIAEKYPSILKKSISIATPNKVAATASHSEFLNLKQLERKFKAQFLFETNVCAGLPVISTLRDLVKSGDRIHKIQAVLSGTLNFLFNNYDGTEKFVAIVRRAKEEGYSEPDPRLDLSGEDVKRKILILARESGYAMEMDDVSGESFVPETCMNAKNIEGFFSELGKQESHFKELLQKAKESTCKIRYVATLENGKAKTELQFVKSNHPFYNLEGSDNIVLFYTDRYSNQPLVVKGAGAGAEVTASGIFADIMRISAANQS
ncbi:MAG: bifunctional aspartate kinase/homoserine dehydrogenase I [Cyclobacteriaceae bacterium]